MGVDYSTTLGYGLTIEEEKFAKISGIEDYIGEEELTDWLSENNYSFIEAETCGNFMSGETYVLFAYKGTVRRVDPRYDDGVKSFENPLFHECEIEEMNLLSLQLGNTKPVSWKMIFNVS